MGIGVTTMKMIGKWCVAGLALAALGGQARGAGLMGVGTDAPASLTKAHEAYLDRDFAAMTSAVREVMTDDAADEFAKRNAADLMSKAFGENHNSLPADWELPSGVSEMKLTQMRREDIDSAGYSLQIR